MDTISMSVIGVALPVILYLAARRPNWLVYAYLMAAPFDAYQLAIGGALVSAADIVLVGLALTCFVLRPQTAVEAPRWYKLSLGLLCIAIGVSVAGNYNVVSIGPARALLAKLVGAYCVACMLIRGEASLTRAMHAFCVGVGASVGVGLLQQFVFLRSGWDALLATLPRVVNPGGVGGSWADQILNRGDLGFAVVSPARGFTPFALRMPGGTPHTALLGLSVTFPMGVGAGALFQRRRPLWTAVALLIVGVLGFCVTEGRAAILGFAVSTAWLFMRSIFLRRSVVLASVLMLLLAVQAGLFVAMADQDMGLRRDAMADAMSDVTRFVIGLGPGEYERESVVGINVHSTPLQLFTDIGIVGLLAYAMLVTGAIIALWRNAHGQEVMILGGAVFGYLVPAILFHPSAGTREHWIVVTLAAIAARCRAPVEQPAVVRPRRFVLHPTPLAHLPFPALRT